ncbi:MAG: quinone oxidoreductase family protein [Archangium sp.]
MRALRFHAFGGPEVLRIDDVPVPPLAGGEALVEVHAGGLNFADTERRAGTYLADQPLPETSGFEAAGVVRDGPPEWVGKRVAFVHPRAHAELCAVPVEKLIELPEPLDFVKAAAFPLQALTAWHVLHTLGRVTAHDTVLIHAAAGGVGQLLVQLALEVGAKVIGTVSREAKFDVVKKRGAQHVLLRGPDFQKQLREVAPGGATLLLEGLGAGVDALASLAPLGRWVTFGAAAGQPAPVPLDSLYEKSITVSAFWLRTAMPRELREQATKEVLERLVAGRLELETTTVPLEHAARAHRRLEGSLTTGKWVLTLR